MGRGGADHKRDLRRAKLGGMTWEHEAACCKITTLLGVPRRNIGRGGDGSMGEKIWRGKEGGEKDKTFP